MFGAEDSAAFLADFGVACKKGGASFMAIYSKPGESYDIGGRTVYSTEHSIEFATADVTLTDGDQITVDGVAFTVRGMPQPQDDGLFSVAKLTA